MLSSTIGWATSSFAESSIGYDQTGIFYVGTVLSALFLSVVAVSWLGAHRSLIFGMVSYALYTTLFGLALWLTLDESGPTAANVQRGFAFTGAVFAGVAAGILWTAQGLYYMDIVGLLNTLRGGESVVTVLGGKFATVYLIFEVGLKILSSAALELPFMSNH